MRRRQCWGKPKELVRKGEKGRGMRRLGSAFDIGAKLVMVAHADEKEIALIRESKDAESQAQAIEELSKAGFGPTRIAELLGTTPNTVNVAIAQAKKRGRVKEG